MTEFRLSIFSMNSSEGVEAASWQQCSEAIRLLNGRNITEVTISNPDEDAYAMISGGENGMYVVSVTLDGESFYSPFNDKHPLKTIYLVCGGQRGDFDLRNIVNIEDAIQIAKTFYHMVALDASIKWVST